MDEEERGVFETLTSSTLESNKERHNQIEKLNMWSNHKLHLFLTLKKLGKLQRSIIKFIYFLVFLLYQRNREGTVVGWKAYGWLGNLFSLRINLIHTVSLFKFVIFYNINIH